jgi:hypothetical protein
LTPAEVDSVLGQMSGTYAVIDRLLYGTGMRLMDHVVDDAGRFQQL